MNNDEVSAKIEKLIDELGTGMGKKYSTAIVYLLADNGNDAIRFRNGKGIPLLDLTLNFIKDFMGNAPDKTKAEFVQMVSQNVLGLETYVRVVPKEQHNNGMQ